MYKRDRPVGKRGNFEGELGRGGVWNVKKNKYERNILHGAFSDQAFFSVTTAQKWQQVIFKTLAGGEVDPQAIGEDRYTRESNADDE